MNTQTIRFGNPTYLQPITLLGEEDAEKVNKASTPLLDQTDIERYEDYLSLVMQYFSNFPFHFSAQMWKLTVARM